MWMEVNRDTISGQTALLRHGQRFQNIKLIPQTIRIKPIKLGKKRESKS